MIDSMENNYLAYAVAMVAIIVFGVLIVTSFMSSGMNNYYNQNTTNLLAITASGSASYNSSQVQLYVTINGTGNTSRAAVQNISLTLNKFNSTIYNYVEGNLSRISTNNFNVYHIYNKSSFEAQEYLTILIPKLGNVSNAIAALSNITNVYVTGATPMLSDSQTSQLRSIALANALQNATAQAHALLGNKTIYTTDITVNNYYVYPMYYSGMGSSVNGYPTNKAGNSTVMPPNFYGGTNKVTESITVDFYYNGTHANESPPLRTG